MMSYFKDKVTAVQFVDATLANSNKDLPLTMIIGRDKSGDYYAHTVTVVSSDDTDLIQATISYDEPTNTSLLNTPAG